MTFFFLSLAHTVWNETKFRNTATHNISLIDIIFTEASIDMLILIY